MAVTNSSDNAKIKALLAWVSLDYPQFSFRSGLQDHWSAGSKTITSDSKQSYKKLAYSLLHELAHGLLEHNNYQSDLELLKMEAKAWDKAVQIGKKYGVKISDEHIQSSLDTYRDWLHKRSSCPDCSVRSLQKNATTYQCFNCGCHWSVTTQRFTRPYRKLQSSN